MIKVGRITASLLIIAVGIMLLVDRIYHTHTITLLITWWSVIPISLGLEILWFSFRKTERKRKFDTLGLFASLFIAAIVFTTTQPSLFQDWVRSVQFDFSMMKQMVKMDGAKTDIPTATTDIPLSVRELRIDQTAGDIYVKTGSQDTLQVEAIVTIFNASPEDVEILAAPLKLRWIEDASEPVLSLKMDGMDKIRQAGYSSRVDLSIKLPRERDLLFNAKVKEGDFYIHDLEGSVQVDTVDGDISISNVGGDVMAHTTSGDTELQNIQGNAESKAASGDIVASEIGGNLHIFTKNGDVEGSELSQDVFAETYSGDIRISTSSLAGTWSVTTLAGDVEMKLPEDLNAFMQVKNSFGDLTSDFPLTITEHEMQGLLGEGLYQVFVQANGDVNVVQR